MIFLWFTEVRKREIYGIYRGIVYSWEIIVSWWLSGIILSNIWGLVDFLSVYKLYSGMMIIVDYKVNTSWWLSGIRLMGIRNKAGWWHHWCFSHLHNCICMILSLAHSKNDAQLRFTPGPLGAGAWGMQNPISLPSCWSTGRCLLLVPGLMKKPTTKKPFPSF